ncbi:MAG: hypothetical protein AB1505_27140, partial [Candidatus Latescibacterota bacterium]
MSVAHPFLVAAALAALLIPEASAPMTTAEKVHPLAIDGPEWRFTSQGRYLLVDDPRALRQVYHPWDVSADGDFGALSATVEVPPGWSGPLYLGFYASDTYVADGWEKVKPTWTHTYAAWHHLPGHRFKQVLVDGRVVWERDVADAEEEAYFSAELLPSATPGQRFELTLRVIDRVGTATPLPTDEFHLGIWSWQGLGDPQAARKLFTRVFWGDLALSAGEPASRQANPPRGRLALHPRDLAAAAPVGRA